MKKYIYLLSGTDRQTTKQNESNHYGVRDLALQGLLLEILREFDFVVGDDGEVHAQLEDDEFLDQININAVTFECLIRLFAKSSGLELTHDEFIMLLMKIEHFIQNIGRVFICDDCLEQMEAVE